MLTSANLVLPVAGQATRFTSHLVFGCKAWHLVREAPSPYRAFFDAATARIPSAPRWSPPSASSTAATRRA